MPDIIQNYFFSELNRIIKEVDKEKIEKVIDILFKAWRDDKTIFFMGCGGSASTASHFVCDISKITIVPGKKRVKAMALVDNVPLCSAWTNDSGWGTVFKEQLENWLKPGDVLVGLSVHGGSGEGDAGPWSQNLVQAMKFAKEKGAKTIGLSGFGGGAMKQMTDACVVVPIDSEPLGTPLVESFHVTLHHLICIALKQRIKQHEEN